MAPTGCNGQNWEFVVVRDPDIRRTWRPATSRRGRSTAPSVSRMGQGDESMPKILKAVEWQVEHFTEMPVLVVACLRGSRVPMVPMPPMADSSYYGSIYPSVQNLLLAARAMGLGASPDTLPLWSTTAARRALGLPMRVQPSASTPRVAPRPVRPTTRRPVGEVVHVDRFGNQPFKA